MRGFTSLLLLLLSALSLTSARPRSSSSYTGSNDVVARRQFRTPRALLDTCADIDLGVFLPGLADVLGHVCLCLSAFPLDLGLDVGLQTAVDLLGADELEARLKLNLGRSGHHCTYPDHGKQMCSSGNPCGFTCEDGYARDGEKCACRWPNTECNGKCGSFPRGCSSSRPRSLRDQTPIKSNSDVTTLREAQLACGSETVCGVYGKSGGYECINPKTNPESCGGCVVPHPFKDSAPSPEGADCSAIDNSSSASCVSGKCVVETCISGFEISASRDSCSVSSHHGMKRASSDALVVPRANHGILHH